MLGVIYGDAEELVCLEEGHGNRTLAAQAWGYLCLYSAHQDHCIDGLTVSFICCGEKPPIHSIFMEL